MSTRRIALLVHAAMVWVVLSVWMSPLAAAHDELIGSEPSNGDALDAMPDEVRLSFDGKPLDLGATVVLVDAAGDDWIDGEPVVDGDVVSTAVRSDAPDGYYQVRWRIVSGDGAVVSGYFSFSVGETSEAPPIPELRSTDRAARPPDAEDAGDFQLNAASPLPGAETADGLAADGTDVLRLAAVAVLGALAALGGASVGRSGSQ